VLNKPQTRTAKRGGRANAAGPRIYSIAAWPDKRAFTGTFSVSGRDYAFTYMPVRADVAENVFRLSGRFEITSGGRTARLDNVRAVLAATQGGIGTPIRRQMIATEATAGTQSTSQQRQQVAGETEKKPEAQSDAQPQGSSLPLTENTGPSSYCGVLYFHFDPLDARTLGVPADLSGVQMNVRLTPLDEAARTLHGLYCYVVDALYGDRADQQLAAAAVKELNRIFAA